MDKSTIMWRGSAPGCWVFWIVLFYVQFIDGFFLCQISVVLWQDLVDPDALIPNTQCFRSTPILGAIAVIARGYGFSDSVIEPLFL